MIKNILRSGLKYFLDLAGYKVTNKNQFGTDILLDLKLLFKSRESLVLFDIGANLGQTTEEYSIYFPNSVIYSFEPEPDTFLRLKESMKNRKNVKFFNVGFGAKQEAIQMNVNKGSGGNSILAVSDQITSYATGDWTEKVSEKKVEITTINNFCEKESINAIDLIKIDTQGYELKIIEGGDRIFTPSCTKAIFIEVLFVELYKEQSYFSDIFKILTSRGFKFVGLYNEFQKTESPYFLLWCDALFVSESI